MDTHQQAQGEISVNWMSYLEKFPLSIVEQAHHSRTFPINMNSSLILKTLLTLLVVPDSKFISRGMGLIARRKEGSICSNLISRLKYIIFADGCSKNATIKVKYGEDIVYTCESENELSYPDVICLCDILIRMLDKNNEDIEHNLQTLNQMNIGSNVHPPPPPIIILSPTTFWVDVIINTE